MWKDTQQRISLWVFPSPSTPLLRIQGRYLPLILFDGICRPSCWGIFPLTHPCALENMRCRCGTLPAPFRECLDRIPSYVINVDLGVKKRLCGLSLLDSNSQKWSG